MPSISRSLSLAVLSSLVLLSSSVSANVNVINIKGNQMIDSVTGARWLMKGVGYDYEVDNAHANYWKPALDLLFATVPDANTLRLYIIEPTAQYDQFIQYTQAKGIYLVVPVTGGEGCGVMNREGTPGMTDPTTCYPSCLLNWGEGVVNAFAGASNTLMFAVANEVINSDARWAAAPCVKAYARDLKSYMNSCNSMRSVPLLYTAADNAIQGLTAEANDRQKADYLACTNPNDSKNKYQSIDVFGLNFFRWCQDVCTYATCGDDKVTQAMQGSPLPMFLTEYGCNNFALASAPLVPAQRDWKETATLFGSDMNTIWSGGSAYTYGVRGGQDFSFFNDGSQDAAGFPGSTKTCGNPSNSCNVDNYAAMLKQVSAASIPLSANATSGTIACPGGAGGKVLGFDLTPPPTRYGANGYNATQYTCPNGTNGNSRTTGGATTTGNGGTTTTTTTGNGGSTSGGTTTTGNGGTTSGSGSGTNGNSSGAAQLALSASVLVGSLVLSSVLLLL